METKNYVDTTETTSCLEWCAGYGGISLGLKRAIPSLRTIAFGEIEAFACANLVAKMEAGLLDPAPIWTDIKTFPCEEFRDRVDILVAGYPCQPFSAAGKRLGTEDPRHLWPYIQRSISIIRPRLCFFENVEGHISLGLSTVISDLEELGYKVSWGIFSASEVGAPHQRKRVFILAYKQCEGLERAAGQSIQRSVCGFAGNGKTPWPSRPGELADAGCQQPQGRGDFAEGQQSGAGRIPRSQPAPRHDQVWPSRPGEQQFWWEPPRVTTGLAHTGSFGRRGRSDGDAGGLRGEIQAAGSCGGGAEAMGNAASERPRAFGAEPAGQQRQASPASAGDAMGNAAQREDHGREPRDMGEAASAGRCGDHAADGTGEGGGLADSLQRRSDGRSNGISGRIGQPSEDEANNGRGDECEIKCEVGRDDYEPFSGVGFAELSGLSHQELAEIREWMVKCDNRTDELRLLGNGVVPATAERAFQVLMEELNK